MAKNFPTFKLIISGKLSDVYAAYDDAIPQAQTRIIWRKGKQVHSGAGGLRTRVQRRLGDRMGKAIRLGVPRQIRIDPSLTLWSKAYRRGPNREYIDIVNAFERTQTIRPRTMLYIPTDAAQRASGQRFRRQVTPSMFRGQMAFLPRRGGGGRRRRNTKQEGVLIHRRTKEVLFVVRRQTRIKRLFQPLERVFERQTKNTADLIASELERQVARRLRRIR